MAKLVPYNPEGAATIDRLANTIDQANSGGFDPINPGTEVSTAPKPQWVQADGVAGALYDGFRTSSFFGGFIGDTLPYYAVRATIPGDKDEDFNPLDVATPEYLASHPWMQKAHDSGSLDDIPNRERFDWYEARQREDFAVRERFGQLPLMAQIAASIPAQITDAMMGGAIAKSLGAGGLLAKAEEAVRTGSTLARIGKGAAITSTLNLGQEEAMRLLNLNRNVDEVEAAKMSIGMGAVFGTAAPLLAKSYRGVRERIDAGSLKNLQRDVSDALSAPASGDFKAEIQANVDALKAATNEVGGLTTEQVADINPNDRFAPPIGATDGMTIDPSRGPRQMTVLRTKETIPYIEELRKKHGTNIEFQEHPLQQYADWYGTMEVLDETLRAAKPADIGRAKGAIQGVLRSGPPLSLLETPGPVLERAPSGLSRIAARLFFDHTVPTREVADDPIRNASTPSAEALKWNYDQWHADLHLKLQDILKEATKKEKIVHTLSDGREMSFKDRDSFRRAVLDELWTREQESRGHSGVWQTDRKVHPAVANAVEEVRKYNDKMGREMVRLGLLSEESLGKGYLTRRWNTERIRENSIDFERRLVQSFRRNREYDFSTGKPIVADERAIDSDVFKNSTFSHELGLRSQDRDAIKAWLTTTGKGDGPKPGADGQGLLGKDWIEQIKETKPTEGELRKALGPEVAQRYLEEVNIYNEKAARSTYETLTSLNNSHGVDLNLPPNPFKERILQIDSLDFKDYLDGDLAHTVDAYHHKTSGSLAARLAIMRDEARLEPIVQQLTGKSLRESQYDPSLIIESIKREYDALLQRPGITEAERVAIENARDSTVGETKGVMVGKLNQLQGAPAFGNLAAETGWSLWLKRNLPTFPYMAQLGKVLISALPDLAGVNALAGMTPRRQAVVFRSLNLFKQLKGRQLQGLYVASSDILHDLRATQIADLPTNFERANYGPGLKGKVLTGTDSAVHWLRGKFGQATGLNRWNTNLKRATATLIMDDMIQSAVRVEHAARLVASGMDEVAALAKAGISKEDQLTMARLGFNAEQSIRLVQKLEEVGLDFDGKPIEGTRDMLGPSKLADKWVSPELSKWAESDRDLFDRFTTAVNSETQNFIVEPKLLSVPLANATLIGRIFNQFTSFAQAWGNQFAPVMLARPGNEIASYMTLAIGMGAITDAIHNQLSGRRTIEDTVRLWEEKPLGMAYAAVNRSGLVGWLGRPLGMLEKTPFGIAKALGNDSMTTYSSQGDLVDSLGPVFSWANSAWKGPVRAMATGKIDDMVTQNTWKMLPFRNLWALDGFNRMVEAMGYDTPIGPRPRYRPDSP